MAFTNYKDLKVWKKSIELTDTIYKLVQKLPSNENYALSEQMRRAVVSIPSNIAEGQGRQTDNEFRNFLSIARGSCYEIETQLFICKRQCYFSELEIKPAFELLEEIEKMLTSMILKLSKN
ncbi:MAG: four helix bundle protein [Oscillospiraceae bacterium]|nr:four helix bundle protein [Candidatus Ruminococcus equi]